MVTKKVLEKMKAGRDAAKACWLRDAAAADIAAEVASTTEAASYAAWNKYVKIEREYVFHVEQKRRR